MRTSEDDFRPTLPTPGGGLGFSGGTTPPHSGGGLDENRLQRCLEGVIRGEGWISVLRGGGGFVLVSQGCVTAQTFVEIEGKSHLWTDMLCFRLWYLLRPVPRCCHLHKLVEILLVKWRMAIRKVPPKKGVALLFSN
jgi:hypothetical protein